MLKSISLSSLSTKESQRQNRGVALESGRMRSDVGRKVDRGIQDGKEEGGGRVAQDLLTRISIEFSRRAITLSSK